MKSGTVAVGFADAGGWSQCFGHSLLNLYLYDVAHNQRLFPHGEYIRLYCPSSSGLPDARNTLAKNFLDSTTCEWLFMVDTDMGFPPDTVERLIDAAEKDIRPVVGGLCFGLQRGEMDKLTQAFRFKIKTTLYDWFDLDDESGFASRTTYERDALVQVGATGGACLILHRRALEKVRKEHGDKWFDLMRIAGRTFSEDLSFCIRLQSVGVPVYVHTGVKTAHHKGEGLYLDEEAFDRQQALEPVPA